MTEISAAGRKPPKMLIADDDPATARILSDECTKIGFEVEIVTNGMQALIKARRDRPDILITDVNMPNIDGFSVSQRLLEPDKKSINVIVITGSNSEEAAVRCSSLGAYLVRKGSNFWSNIYSLLATLHPDMAGKIKELETQSVGREVWVRPRVLVVDDDPDIHSFLSSRLGKFGVDTLYAADFVQGFKIACRYQPSVILSDHYIPNGNLLYMLWRLRSTALTENIPVFVMSGKRLDEPTQQALKREVCGRPGVARVFQKSFDTDELFQALQKICGFATTGGSAENDHFQDLQKPAQRWPASAAGSSHHQS
jgi:CheY-like chemotaxis protein